MELPIEHLATFAAILDEGSFEGAAKRLRITPSAVSQRVKAMEQRVGSVLLQRTRPVAVTAAGATVLRLARQLDRLVDDAARELGAGPAGAGSGPAIIPIVVNADSLATWFVPALARAARETGAHFEVLRADETVSTAALRSGTVVAALTATREPVPGCISTRIGAARYRAVASPEFIAQHFPNGTSASSLAAAPMLEFDRHDTFQQRYLRAATRARVDPPRHYVPSSAEFARAVELGMGWGMLPEAQSAEGIAAGRLAELTPSRSLKLPLYWQRWNLHSPVLDALSQIVEEEGKAALEA
ncbi:MULTISPECIES: LysR family transcriptional regulator ArgP [unclassified Leucobacter]|uniref:LysR family transcriptional regulator ArgP n=1 Tax=unclassified Leucobacter TaxID=2621730 RepID=UPI00165E1841|nr:MULTISPECIES: LysR family transcriptional regulator ArgP [unclassified Leucobacter]MBC9927117.1 LysR family transcriptional regulator ArgP [Leucobacter sp. cx-169]MBC9936398.1 LysR family transcriptional regulator ArgP [Leucobacter sp. cx-87]